MRVRTFPERYLAYMEGAIERALHDIEVGEIPGFMVDECRTGTAMLLIGATDTPAETKLSPVAQPRTARRKAARSTR